MSWFRRLTNTFSSGRIARDIDREISFHVAERADDLRADGLNERDALCQARARFGNASVQAERTRAVDVALWLDGLLRHLRYAVRTLWRAPAFTAVVVATLALGIGANTAVFSTLDAVVLRPLPFPQADRLVRVSQHGERDGETSISPARLTDWNRLSSSFESLSGYYVEDASETSGDLPERVRRAFVAPGFFEVLRIAPAIGRSFAADEQHFGGPAAAIISHRFWQERLGGDPDVLGRTVRIGRTPYPIIGVMPATFRFTDRRVDIWFPSPMDAPYAQTRTASWFTGVARLRPGISPEQARADMLAVQSRLSEQYPETDSKLSVGVVPLKSTTIGDVGGSLWLLFAAVSILLVIACTNIAALLVSRGTQRQHEMAVRLSLGASRRALALQLLAETAVLAVLGGALGLGVAGAATTAIRTAAGDLPRIDEVVLDRRILLYTLGSTVVVTLLCGILPAIRAARGRVASPCARTQVSSQTKAQWLLVGAQVTLSVTLLAAGGLLLRSFAELSRVDPGFDPSRLLAFRVSGTWNETADYPKLTARIDATIDRMRQLPGVVGAATTGWSLPGLPEQWESTFVLKEATDDHERRMAAEGRAVSAEYFATLGVPIVAGEVCRRGGGEVIVNAAFVARYLSARPSVIGLSIGQPDKPAARIVGVAANVRERGLDREPGPTVYWCQSTPNPSPYFVVRTNGDPAALVQTIRLEMKQMEPLRSVYEAAPLSERLGDAYKENRVRTVLVTLFAGSALLLACVGLYGTLSYVVSQRRREVGLRLAIGATRTAIVRQFLSQGLRVAVIACALGLALSMVFARTIAGMLYGISAYDPSTLAVVVLVVLLFAALATFVPSIRAAFIEPIEALRES